MIPESNPILKAAAILRDARSRMQLLRTQHENACKEVKRLDLEMEVVREQIAKAERELVEAVK